MDREASEAVIAEIIKSKNQPFHLLVAEFSSTTYYLTDAWSSITWDGHTYTALGHFLSFSDIEETSSVQVSSITIQLSGIDQTVVYSVLAENYIDRTVKIYKGFLDDSSAVIVDPILIFEGRMDSPIIQENPDDGTCVVSVSATNTWVDFERLAGRHTNHEEQQLFYPGDKGFEYASEFNKEVLWGRI